MRAEPFPDSVCHGCRHLERVAGKNTTFLKCAHPALPKYPPQPVTDCKLRAEG